MKKEFGLVIICLFIYQTAFAQGSKDTIGLYLDLPLIDLPYQSYASKTTGNIIEGYANPSMQQSLAMSNNLYGSAHWGIKKLIKTDSEFNNILFRNGAAAAFDLFSLYIPFGVGWLHEEYHRAVMTVYEINSFNDMNTFPFGSNEVSVRKVLDEDLVRLSDNHNPDFVRLMTAGNEAQYHQIQTLQKENFFYNQDLPHIPLYWISTFTNIIYVNESAADSFDDLVDEINESDGADVAKRDFTGPDFTAWVNSLFYPTVPYSDRGLHPSGVGINRYIKPSGLTDESREYLEKQGNLQWLNILSPHLFGFPKFKLRSTESGDYFGSFSIRHLLTSFGNDISLDIFYQTPNHNLFFSLHNYNNRNSSFGGIEVALIDEPYAHGKLLISGRGMLWIQPENQSFNTNNGSIGGLLGLKTTYSSGLINPYFNIEGKTEGWVMGNEFLEYNISFILGLEFRID